MRGAKQKEMFEISDLRREILHLRSVCLFPRGYSYISMHTKARAIFGGSKFLISIFWFFFQKTKYFWGYADFVDIFWGHHEIGLYNAFKGLF